MKSRYGLCNVQRRGEFGQTVLEGRGRQAPGQLCGPERTRRFEVRGLCCARHGGWERLDRRTWVDDKDDDR